MNTISNNNNNFRHIGSVSQSQSHVLLFLVNIAERKVTPALYRALSLRYSRYFNFGVVPSYLAPAALGLKKKVKVPRLDILISTITPNKTAVNMAALHYEVEKYGPIQYRYLIRFLFSAHEKHWKDLPGSKKFTEELGYEEYYKDDLKRIFANPENPKYKKKLQNPDIQEINYGNHKKTCDDSTPGYCVVAFLDGKPKVLKRQLSVLTDVSNDEHLQGKIYCRMRLSFYFVLSSTYKEGS